jgi:hypothetical protein
MFYAHCALAGGKPVRRQSFAFLACLALGGLAWVKKQHDLFFSVSSHLLVVCSPLQGNAIVPKTKRNHPCTLLYHRYISRESMFWLHWNAEVPNPR